MYAASPEALWTIAFEELTQRVQRSFLRKATRDCVQSYLRGRLSSVERKNGWQIAEEVGELTPYGIQYLLDRAKWDADGIRNELRAYVCEALADPHTILIVDETGFLKKGTKSVGVQRQYSGTAGRIENCQIGIFLAYTSPKGHALIDRELYLPKSWTHDSERCQAAHVPEEIAFATKPMVALQMLQRAWDADDDHDQFFEFAQPDKHRPLARTKHPSTRFAFRALALLSMTDLIAGSHLPCKRDSLNILLIEPPPFA